MGALHQRQHDRILQNSPKLISAGAKSELGCCMELSLTIQSKTVRIPLDGVNWKVQASPFAVVNTFPPGSIPSKVFVKKYNRRRADGHDLLLTCPQKQIVATPNFYGHIQFSDENYYIFEYLNHYRLISDLFENRNVHHDKLLSLNLINNLVTSMFDVLEAVNQRGFYHPDVSYKNIMIDPEPGKLSRLAVIDLDSCLPFSASVSAMKCDQTWWALYTHQCLSQTQFLNPTMMLALTLVLGKAIGDIWAQGKNVNVADVLKGGPDEQQKLFTTLDEQNLSRFIKIFGIGSNNQAQINDVFSIWRVVIHKMKTVQPVPWKECRAFSYAVLELYRLASADTLNAGRVKKISLPDPKYPRYPYKAPSMILPGPRQKINLRPGKCTNPTCDQSLGAQSWHNKIFDDLVAGKAPFCSERCLSEFFDHNVCANCNKMLPDTYNYFTQIDQAFGKTKRFCTETCAVEFYGKFLCAECCQKLPKSCRYAADVDNVYGKQKLFCSEKCINLFREKHLCGHCRGALQKLIYRDPIIEQRLKKNLIFCSADCLAEFMCERLCSSCLQALGERYWYSERLNDHYRKDRRFCSEECLDLYWEQHTCAHCSSLLPEKFYFNNRLDITIGHEVRFCSEKCITIYRKEQLCQQCGRKLPINEDGITFYYHNINVEGRFCSEICLNKHVRN